MTATQRQSAMAAVWLRQPVTGAVQHLQTQLLMLLKRGNTASDYSYQHSASQALGDVVALCCFFPHTHPLYEAAGELEAVCVPLIADRTGASKRRLPEFCFRILQQLAPDSRLDLQRCVLERLKQFDCAAACNAQNSPARILALKQLRLFSFITPADPGIQPKPASHAERQATQHVAPRIALLRAQYRLTLAIQIEDSGASTAIDALVLPLLHQQIDAIAHHCAQSDWSLAYFCESELAVLLHNCESLAVFCAKTTWVAALQNISNALLGLHLLGRKPASDARHTLLCDLFALRMSTCVEAPTGGQAEGGALPGVQTHPGSGVSIGRDAALVPQSDADFSLDSGSDMEALLKAELLFHRDALQAWVETADTENFQSLDAPKQHLYKLSWILAAAGNAQMARLAGLAFQVWAQHWFIGKPCTADMLVLMQQLLTQIMPCEPHFFSGDRCKRLQRQLLLAWPDSCRTANLPIVVAAEMSSMTSSMNSMSPSDPLASDAVISERARADSAVNESAVNESARAERALTERDLTESALIESALIESTMAPGRQVVALQAMPALLSASFACLLQQVMQPQNAGTASGVQLLQRELALLEKGAAALKIWPLEQLCILLLDMYALLEQSSSPRPTALLREAHLQLVEMLDQAAAWRQIHEDLALTTRLQGWLDKQAQQRLYAAPGAPCENQLVAMQSQLEAFVKALSLALEKPVRLQFGKFSEGLGVSATALIEASLKPLLKFIVL
ncbi:MAG: hypothetical protein ITG01_11410, partial [Comamonas sp.]|nr:hypothetical protein [Comamonas sp.]